MHLKELKGSSCSFNDVSESIRGIRISKMLQGMVHGFKKR